MSNSIRVHRNFSCMLIKNRSGLIVYSFVFLLFSSSFIGNDPDEKEARAAYVLLNKVRQDPKAFLKDFPFLKDVEPKSRLIWNDTLARVAQTKAADMAKRNYFAHVDPDGYGMNYYISQAGYTLEQAWLKDPKANYFESCNAGALNGEDAIRILLADNGVPSLGHRKHLLGLDPWSASLLDIGIGYVQADSTATYRSYTCVLIAKHKK